MSAPGNTGTVDVEALRKLGGKWAVLTGMGMAIAGKGVALPSQVKEQLKMARVKIGSGCFSPCEVECTLNEAERYLFAQGPVLGDEPFMMWSNLLSEAMGGRLDYERILATPALEPIKNDCQFLGCTCAQH